MRMSTPNRSLELEDSTHQFPLPDCTEWAALPTCSVAPTPPTEFAKTTCDPSNACATLWSWPLSPSTTVTFFKHRRLFASGEVAD